MNTLLQYSGWGKLIKMYYDVDISDQFIRCADRQLTEQFQTSTGLEVKSLIRLECEQEKELGYNQGITSSISSTLWLKYGKIDVKILWKSISGRIYHMADVQFDCDDIRFWFEGVNAELCRPLVFPRWSLITFKKLYLERFRREHQLEMTESFVDCMDEKLSDYFEREAGVKINKQISLTLAQEHVFHYTKGEISSFASTLYVNHNWQPITIYWKSLSGRIYDITDVDIDKDDVVFLFEVLDVAEIHRQLFPKNKTLFNIKNLSFELVVTRINIDCTIEMFLKEEKVEHHEIITTQVNEYINQFNEKSELKDRKYGVIHNWQTAFHNNKITYELDLGSVGILFFKKLLPFLSQLHSFTKVEVC